MTPEDKVRWERLQGRRRTSEFVRHLMDLAEEEAARHTANATLDKILEAQRGRPAAWLDDATWDCDSLGDDVSPLPTPFTTGRAVIEVSEAARAGLLIGPR